MNESTIEEQLRRVRPAAPSPALEQRIGAALASTAPSGVEMARTTIASGVLHQPAAPFGLVRWWRDLAWALGGAAAAILAVTFFSPDAPTAQPQASAPANAPAVAQATMAPDTFEHSTATEELVATENATEIVETDAGLVRPVRYTYLERHVWANARTGAQMEIEVPREDVYLRPVSLQ